MTLFTDDIKKGKIGEEIFVTDFLNFLDIKYQDVTNSQKFQIIDTDYLTKIGTYEIKTNYKDDEIIVFEEYTNINPDLGKISLGWIYKTNSYQIIRENTELIKNKYSEHNNKRWQSAFRKVPFKLLKGFISVYRLK
jgi:hypothetical protein